MATSVNFSTIGFLNDQWPLSEINWATYFSPAVPDGIIAGIDSELAVDATSTGMNVRVQPGECRIRSHRGALSANATVDIAASHKTYPRIDLIVARVTYGNPSTMVITSKKGTPAANPVCPTVTQTAGSVWEIPLAEVYIPSKAVTISADNVTDRRYVYQTSGTAAISFSGETLTVANDWEYRSSDESISNLTIALPAADPSGIWMCAVNFTADETFSGVAFTRGGSTYAIKAADNLTYQDTRYNLIIWWDGAYFWCGAKTA